MRNFFIYVILIGFLGLIQKSFFFDEISIGMARPDLLLILITYIAFKKGSMEGQFAGFGAGFMMQISSSAPFGAYCFVFTVVGFVMGLVQRKVYSENFITAIILVFAATLVKGLAFGFLALFAVDVAQSYPTMLKNGLLLELIINPLLAGPLFWVFGRFASPVMK